MPSKKVPHPGKKWAEDKITCILSPVQNILSSMDRAELEAIIATVDGYTNTNWHWLKFRAKEFLKHVAESQLDFITPQSQKVKHG